MQLAALAVAQLEIGLLLVLLHGNVVYSQVITVGSLDLETTQDLLVQLTLDTMLAFVTVIIHIQTQRQRH